MDITELLVSNGFTVLDKVRTVMADCYDCERHMTECLVLEDFDMNTGDILEDFYVCAACLPMRL